MTLPATLEQLRPCFEGAIPATLCTVAADGTPNVAYVSQVFHVDERHVALSFQFFNKTRANILANPHAVALLLDPRTAAYWRLHLRYLRTETEGALFERMKAQLAGIASHEGMADVFRLRGSDIYAVEEIEAVPGEPLTAPAPRRHALATVRRVGERLSACTVLDEALEAALGLLCEALRTPHAQVLMLDPATGRLYTVASHGYATSGVGAEIGMGEGVIGVAARERTAIRIGHMSAAYRYGAAVRSGWGAGGTAPQIPYPGLERPRSQVAAPIVSARRLLGVLFMESEHDLHFDYEDEDALAAVAHHLGAVIDCLQAEAECADPPVPARHDAEPGSVGGTQPRAVVRHHAGDNSVFIGDHYLIKGVAGAILHKLLRAFVREGRTEFSNRELRLDPALGLPEVADNLEARILLLARRLQEQDAVLRIERPGRGRLRLVVCGPIELREG